MIRSVSRSVARSESGLRTSLMLNAKARLIAVISSRSFFMVPLVYLENLEFPYEQELYLRDVKF